MYGCCRGHCTKSRYLPTSSLLFLFGGNNNPFHTALVVYSIEKCRKDGHPLQAYLVIQYEQ